MTSKQIPHSFLLAFFFSLIFLAPAWAGGIPEGPNVVVTDAGLGDDTATRPDIAVVGNNVYAVWEDGRPNPFGADLVYFSKSTDGGQSWGPNVQVNDLPYDDWADEPQIAVTSAGTIFVVWHTLYKDDSDKINDVRLAISTDGGESFLVDTLIDGFNPSGDRSVPLITVDLSTDRVYVLSHEYRVLDEDEGYYIDIASFNADGSVVSAFKRVNDADRSGRGTYTSVGSESDVPYMSLTARGGTVCAAWEDKRERASIFGACSTDGGATFGANFNISGADGIEPDIGLGADGALYAVYSNSSDNDRHIRLRRSPDLGATWEDERQVTAGYDVVEVHDWDLAVDDNGQIAVAWIDEQLSRGDVFLSTSLDQGLNFGRIRVDDDPEQNADVFNVSIAVGGSGTETRAYLAWRDDRIDFDDKIWAQTVLLDGIAPTQPTDLLAESKDNAVLLTWKPSTDDTGIRGYRVYRSASADGPFALHAPLMAYAPFYRDVELDGSTYFYRVAAVDGTGNLGLPSEIASAAASVGTEISASGTIAYDSGENILLRDLPGVDNQRTPTQGSAARFSADGSSIFYYSNRQISSKPLAGGSSQLHLSNEELTAIYDVSTDGTKFGAIVQDSFPGINGSFCFVSEPTYFDQGLPRYTDENNLSPDLALSSTGKWLAYSYLGFCNAVAFGVSSPPDFCVVNTETSEKNCIDGADFETPDFAAKGSRMVFAAKLTGQHEIWSAKLQDNGTLTNFIQLTRGPANQPSSHPQYSSNGEWVVFQRDMDTSEDEDFQLYIVRSNGTGIRPLNISGTSAAWHNGAPTAPPDPNPFSISNPDPEPDPGGGPNASIIYLPFVRR